MKDGHDNHVVFIDTDKQQLKVLILFRLFNHLIKNTCLT